MLSHSDLVIRAEKWLEKQGCGVVFRDGFVGHTLHGERPDAIGFRSGVSILIECKASRSDFLADQSKRFRIDPKKGMGDWRFYLCPPEVIYPSDLPSGWGLLWVTEKQIRKVHGAPNGNWNWFDKRPFEACKRSESMFLVTALRRLKIRGHFEEIYSGIPDDCLVKLD